MSLLAACGLLAASGICVRQAADVPLAWLIGSWVGAFAWLFILDRPGGLFQSDRFLWVFTTTVGLSLLAQSTGADQSPLILAVFVLMGVVAWHGEAKFAFWVAILFCLLEALSLRKQTTAGPEAWALYLRWAALLVSAFFLARIVKTRTEKEQLGQRLESLKREADRFAQAEPSSFNIPKDKLLREESRLTARVGTVMGLEESLGQQAALFQKALKLHSACVFLFTALEDKKVLRLRASASASDALAPDVTLLPGESLVGLAAKEGKRVLLNQMAGESARALPYYLKPNPIGSFLAQPLYGRDATAPDERGDLAGLVVLDSLSENFFGDHELELVEGFCANLEGVLENNKTLHFSKTKSRNLHALYEVSKEFSTQLNYPKVLQIALSTAVDILPCDSAYIAIAHEDGKVFEVAATWSRVKAGNEPTQLDPELAVWVQANRKPIRYTRGQKDRSLVSFARREGMLGSIQSFLMVPLIAGGDLLGVIRLNSHQSDAYQEYDQDVLSTLANQTSMAIKNAVAADQIRNLAERDGLTGLYNHRFFQERLEEELAKADRYNKDLGFLLMDVDHFKKFNDTYGHQEGDKVLRAVAEIAQGTIRQKVDILARYGGEEFAVILPETDLNAARDLAERVRRNIADHAFESENKTSYKVTVSIGVSTYPFDAREQSKLIQAADEGLYESKRRGRNCVTLFKDIPKPASESR
ncbi:MAG TPA: sensor domain-containing diguanylate cyclase [bacterium]|nr:sensor domain-containing diguanylate cyclase [bacterium]